MLGVPAILRSTKQRSAGYLPCLPIVWINDCSKKLTLYPFLFKYGMVGQISVKGIEDTAFLGKEISQQLTAIEDFLPVQISVWSSYVSRQAVMFQSFICSQIIDEEPEGLKTLASDEVKPVNFDPEDLSRMRGHAIKVITKKLQDTTERWYNLYSCLGHGSPASPKPSFFFFFFFFFKTMSFLGAFFKIYFFFSQKAF
jgi:hypothetical protein